jgi:hypothetical protein
MSIDNRRRKVNAWRVGDRLFASKSKAQKHGVPERILVVGSKERIEQ